MKSFFLFALIFSFGIFLQAQNAQQDSIQSWENLYKQGKALYEAGQYEAAFSYGKAAMEVLEKTKPQTREISLKIAETAILMGVTVSNLGDFESGRKYLLQGLDIVQNEYGEKHEKSADAIGELTTLYILTGSLSEAEIYCEKLLNIQKELNGERHPKYAEVLARRAEIYKKQNSPEAEKTYIEALKIFEEISLPDKEAQRSYGNCLNNLGVFYFEIMSDHKKAEYFLKKAMEVRKNTLGTQHPEYAETLGNLSVIFMIRNDYLQAKSMLLTVLDIFGEKHPYAGTLFNNTGVSEEHLGNFDEAIRLHKKSIELSEKVFGKNNPEVRTFLNNLALAYKGQGKYREADSVMRKSLKLFEDKKTRKDTLDYFTALNNMADIYTVFGDNERAIESYLALLTMLEQFEGKNSPSYAQSLNNLGLTYKDQKEYDKAEAILIESGEIYNAILGDSSYEYALYLHNLGLLYYEMQRFDDALRLKTQSLSIINKTLNKGWTYALSLNDLALLNMVKADYNKADSLYLEALQIIRKTHGESHPIYLLININLAKSYALQHRTDEAKAIFIHTNEGYYNHFIESQVGLIESERYKFWRSLSTQFEAFYSFSEKHNRHNPELVRESYNYRLKTNGILFNNAQAVFRAIIESGDNELINIFNDWKAQKTQIANWTNWGACVDYSKWENSASGWSIKKQERLGVDLKQAIHKADSLEKILSQKAGNFASLTEATTTTWEQIQEVLQAGEAAIEIIRYRTPMKNWFDLSDTIHYAALIITAKTKDNPIFVLFENGKELEAKYTEYINAIENQNTQNLKALYLLFWQPIAEKLKGIKTIYLSPEGVFHKINLNTLCNEKGKYVLELYDIHLVSSTKEILSSQEFQGGKDKSIVLFGNPTFNLSVTKMLQYTEKNQNEPSHNNSLGYDEYRGNYEPLPQAEEEVKEIGKLLSQNHWATLIYVKDSASENQVKQLTNPGVLHIATHGYYPARATPKQQNPMLLSGLLFAGAYTASKTDSALSYEDGRLSAYEAANLRLSHTDLVVLSACGTGLGPLDTGEGVMGLQRAFRMAGAKKVVYSFWNIKDDATQVLMVEFYSKLNRGKSPHEALRSTQLFLLKKTPVKIWGSFADLGI